MTTYQKQQVDLLVDGIYKSLEEPLQDRMDCVRFVSAMSVLCAGKKVDKVRDVFLLYDNGNKGESIEYDDLVEYMESVYKMIYLVNPETWGNLEESPLRDLAQVSVDQCYADVQLRHTDRLPLNLFQQWYTYGEIKIEGEGEGEGKCLICGEESYHQNSQTCQRDGTCWNVNSLEETHIVVWYGNKQLGDNRQYHSTTFPNTSQARDYYNTIAHGWVTGGKGVKSRGGVGNTRMWFKKTPKCEYDLIEMEKGYLPPSNWRCKMEQLTGLV